MQPDTTPLYTGNTTAIQMVIEYEKKELVKRISDCSVKIKDLEGQIQKIDEASAKNPQPFRRMLKSIGLGFIMNSIAPSYASQKEVLVSQLQEQKFRHATFNYTKDRQGELCFITRWLTQFDDSGKSLLNKGEMKEITALYAKWKQKFGQECDDFVTNFKSRPPQDQFQRSEGVEMMPKTTEQAPKSSSAVSGVPHHPHESSLSEHADVDMVHGKQKILNPPHNK